MRTAASLRRRAARFEIASLLASGWPFLETPEQFVAAVERFLETTVWRAD